MKNILKTVINRVSWAVLTDETNKVVAIIICKPNTSIDEAVIQAIKEDRCATEVRLLPTEGVLGGGDTLNFRASVTDEVDSDKYDFELTIAAVY